MFKRALIFVHRWLGVVLSLLFLIWFPSAIGIMYWEYPGVSASDRLERSPDLDPATQRFVLQIDGQTTDTKGQKQPVTWPGPNPGNAIPTFEARYFDPPKPYGGPWAWFRMVDDHRAGAPDAQQRIGLSIQDSYHRVRVTVEPARATGNPFASGSWRQFSCES